MGLIDKDIKGNHLLEWHAQAWQNLLAGGNAKAARFRKWAEWRDASPEAAVPSVAAEAERTASCRQLSNVDSILAMRSSVRWRRLLMLCSRGRMSGDNRPAPLVGKEAWLGSCAGPVPLLGRVGSRLRWVAWGCTSVPLPIERAATGGRDGITCTPGTSDVRPALLARRHPKYHRGLMYRSQACSCEELHMCM